MHKIKTFYNPALEMLENSMNTWLEEHNTNKIIKIKIVPTFSNEFIGYIIYEGNFYENTSKTKYSNPYFYQDINTGISAYAPV